MADLEDIYWAAGLFEGEGCITTQKTKTHVYAEVMAMRP